MIGERLKRARDAAGLSMQSLGKQAGVSAPMIQKYERDESMPSSSVLIQLAKALNVRTEFFFPAKSYPVGRSRVPQASQYSAQSAQAHYRRRTGSG